MLKERDTTHANGGYPLDVQTRVGTPHEIWNKLINLSVALLRQAKKSEGGIAHSTAISSNF